MAQASKAATSKRPATFDHLKKKQPLERVVPVHTDNDALVAYQDAVAAMKKVTEGGPEWGAAKAALDEAKATLDATTIHLRFRSIGRKAYADLLEEHPATEEQKAEEDHPAYNSETFAIALVAASCVEPKMTEEQVQELSDEWNANEFVPLWLAAIEVNNSRRVVELGDFSNGTRS